MEGYILRYRRGYIACPPWALAIWRRQKIGRSVFGLLIGAGTAVSHEEGF
jgi:hypothetical protein